MIGIEAADPIRPLLWTVEHIKPKSYINISFQIVFINAFCSFFSILDYSITKYNVLRDILVLTRS